MIDIRKRVKSLCKEKGITLNKLAEKTGVQQSTLASALKTGDPKISMVMAIASFFGMSLTEFMQEEKRWKPSSTFILPDGTKVGLFPMVIR